MSQHPSRLLMISGVRISRSRADLAADEPVPDYVVIREDLSADVLDPTTVRDVRHPLVRATSRIFGPMWAIALAALIDRSRYDGIFATGEDVGLRLAALCRLAGVQANLLVACHNISGRRSRFLLQRLHAGRAVAAFHCLNSGLARTLHERYRIPEERIELVHWHVDDVFFHPESTEVPQLNRICSAGTASRDYATLLEAVRGLDVEVKIAADSPWFREKLNADPNAAPPNVEIKSFGTYAALRDLYASSQFVVVPLLDVDRAAGISVVLEAMAMGRAVIATRTRCGEDLVVDGRSGLHVRPGEAEELRDRILFLLDQPDEARRMGVEGRRLVEDRYTIQAYVQRLRLSLDQWKRQAQPTATSTSTSPPVSIHSMKAPDPGADS